MTASVIPPGPRLHTPVGHAVRTGEMAHCQYEHLHAAGRFPAERVIADASRAGSQKEFIRALRDVGTDVIPDTRTAEPSAPGRFRGMAKGAPWAADMEGQPPGPRDFQPDANIDLFGRIARMAVGPGVAAVMAPTRFLRYGADDFRFAIDLESVTHLRLALDREGGKSIDIGYSLILPHTLLRDRTHRTRLMEALKGLPFDNLVLRLSGFGSNARPLSVKRTFAAIEDLHGLGYPVLLDHIGCLVGLGALALGVVSGIAHGIGERDRFDARNWHKPPRERKEGGSFGRPTYIPLFGFDSLPQAGSGNDRRGSQRAAAGRVSGSRMLSARTGFNAARTAPSYGPTAVRRDRSARRNAGHEACRAFPQRRSKAGRTDGPQSGTSENRRRKTGSSARGEQEMDR